jgi:hypothetical protein
MGLQAFYHCITARLIGSLYNIDHCTPPTRGYVINVAPDYTYIQKNHSQSPMTPSAHLQNTYKIAEHLQNTYITFRTLGVMRVL